MVFLFLFLSALVAGLVCFVGSSTREHFTWIKLS